MACSLRIQAAIKSKCKQENPLNIENTVNIWSCSCLRNAAKSPLLRLPPEIRNTVLRYVFTEPESISFVEETGTLRVERGPHLECLLACRQIYAEAALFPFSLRVFEFRCSNPTMRRIISLMLPPQLAEILTIRIDSSAFFRVSDFETSIDRMIGLRTVQIRRSFRRSTRVGRPNERVMMCSIDIPGCKLEWV